MAPPDARQYSPATQRNREPILEVLLQVLPPRDTILEIASGSGEHAVFFASKLKTCRWLPTEVDPQLRASIISWIEIWGGDNIDPPLELDVTERIWPVEKDAFERLHRQPIVAIVNINMIHISPWSACLGLMAGAGRLLKTGGILYLYGPFKQGGEHTAASNAAFDQYLRAQNPEWGVRNLEDVVAVAEAQNLTFKQIYQMPANNLSVVFERST
jgi:hypothetical protein